MITMGGFSLPSRTIREMICASIDVIIQAARLRDGSRRITHITEVMGMGPEELAQAAQALATRYGASYSAIVGDELTRQNFPLIHASLKS